MKIAVDAMGGDYAPEALVEGSLLAMLQCPVSLALFGDETRLRAIIGRTEPASSIEVIHAPETIGMDEAGPMAIRKKREASLSVAMRFLAENQVDAVVSAGNSSAVVAASKHFVGLIAGLRRSAMAVPIPTPAGKVLLLDAGAHAEASTVHLAQSAALAHIYLKVTEGLNPPRIGLLNIGQEPLKGTKVIQRAFTLLKRSHLHFIGNVEPQGLLANQVDAAICDGFAGNVLLKACEGLSETFVQFLETQMEDEEPEIKEKLRCALQRLHRIYQYENVGGAPLLGVKKTVVVAHGRSQGPAIASAINLAFQLVKERIYERMAEELENDSILAELKHSSALLMLENLKNKWGFAPK